MAVASPQSKGDIMNREKEAYLESKMEQFIEESIDDNGEFINVWFIPNMLSVIKEMYDPD